MNNLNLNRHVELLAPAGSRDGFRGALNAGCDAVYLGGPAFGARAYADNFTEDELIDTIELAHLHGVKVYMTVNILTREQEMESCLSMTERMYSHGLDGVIVQDLGVLAALRERCPGLLLHASTQLSSTLPESVRFLKRLGVSRIVPARELSLQEIRQIKAEGIEVEAFIHGAMCYCYSGRCLMSSMLGGRSGNRGRCAGTCRLPYTVLDADGRPVQADLMPEQLTQRQGTQDAHPQGQFEHRLRGRGKSGRNVTAETRKTKETYPISMRDMCTLEILPELIDAGIDSFKIEGRMKKPAYAAGVTAVYRRCIDRFYAWDQAGRPGKWQVPAEDLQEVKLLYLRSALCQGYYHERNGRDMVTMSFPGYAGTDEKLLEKISRQYVEKRPQLPVRGRAVILPGEAASLTLRVEGFLDRENRQPSAVPFSSGKNRDNADPDHSLRDSSAPYVEIRCTGPMVLRAQQHPMTAADLQKRFMKTGNEDFCFSHLEVVTNGEAFLPLSAVNELRREAMQSLRKALLEQRRPPVYCGTREDRRTDASDREQVTDRTGVSGLMALVIREDQLHGAMAGGADSVVLDGPALECFCRGKRILTNCAAVPAAAENNGEGKGRSFVSGQQAACTSIGTEAGNLYNGMRVYLALPYIMREADRSFMEKMVGFAKADRRSIAGFLCRTPEEIEFLWEKGYDGQYIADSSVYRWNRKSDAVISRFCSSGVLPLELSGRELLETFGSSMDQQILPVYGRIPMMVTANCVRKSTGNCRKREEGFWYLRDRKQAVFPVRTDCRHCTNIIYNSIPLSLHSFLQDEAVQKAGAALLSFTDEDGAQTQKVTRYFRTLLDGKAPAKEEIPSYTAEGSFTTGHYRKGAL